MFKLMLFLAFISSSVHAQNIERLLATAVAPDPLTCDTQAAPNDCAVDLCGHPSKTVSATLTNEILQQMNADLLKDKDKKLEELEIKMRRYLKTHNENLKTLKELLQRNPPKVDLEKFSSFERYQIEYDVFKQYIGFDIDHTKGFSERIVLNMRAPDWMTSEEKKVLRQYAEKEKIAYLQDVQRLIASEVLTLDESRAKVLELWKEVSDLPIISATREELVKKLENLNQLDHDELHRNYQLLTETKRTIKGGSPASTTDPRCDNADCRKIMMEFLEKKYKELSQKMARTIEPHTISEDKIKDRAKTCLANSIARQERIKKAEVFRKELPRVIEEFITKGMSNSSAHSITAFRNFLNHKVEFSLGDHKPLALAEELEIYNVPGNPEKKLNKFQSLIWSPLTFLEECLPLGAGKDQVVQREGNLDLQLSYFSCSTEGVGKQIMAHELGHVLSYAISKGHLSPGTKEHFLKARECVTKRHKYPTSGPHYDYAHPTDFLHSEEDHADFIAAQVYPTDGLSLCSLLDQSTDREKYVVDLAKASGPHSNSLLRVLWQASSRNKKLPKSCEDILKTQDNYDLRSCNEFK